MIIRSSTASQRYMQIMWRVQEKVQQPHTSDTLEADMLGYYFTLIIYSHITAGGQNRKLFRIQLQIKNRETKALGTLHCQVESVIYVVYMHVSLNMCRRNCSIGVKSVTCSALHRWFWISTSYYVTCTNRFIITDKIWLCYVYLKYSHKKKTGNRNEF